MKINKINILTNMLFLEIKKENNTYMPNLVPFSENTHRKPSFVRFRLTLNIAVLLRSNIRIAAIAIKFRKSTQPMNQRYTTYVLVYPFSYRFASYFCCYYLILYQYIYAISALQFIFYFHCRGVTITGSAKPWSR